MTTLKEILASTVYGNAGDDMELMHKIDGFIGKRKAKRK